MPIADLLSRILRWIQGESPSKDAAKSRLQLILIQDRVGVDTGVLDALREDMVDLLRKYFEVSEEGLDVQLQRADDSIALVASIPILSMKGRHAADFGKLSASR
jgi:cell division topological specificity factor